VATGRELLVLLVLLAADIDGDARRRGVRGRVGDLAGSLSNRVLDEVDPDAVVQRIDIDALVKRIDIDALVARIDIDAVVAKIDADALVAKIDVEGLVGRVDVDGLVGRIDVNAVLERVDVNAVLDRVDVNTVLDRVDVDRLLQRADVDALLGRADINALLDRVDVHRVLDRVDLDRVLAEVDVGAVVARIDVDAVLDRVDVERVVDRLDLEALMRRAGIPELIADSTGQVAGSALDLARRQLVGLDVGISRVLQRLLGRDPKALPAGPPTLVADPHTQVAAPAPVRSRTKARMEVSGYYAGPLSRVAALGGDIAAATTLFTAGLAVLSWLLQTILNVELGTSELSGPLWALALVVWFFLYWWVPTTIAGRTPVMLAAGLRIVSRDGSPLRPVKALVRTLTLPLSLLFFGLGGLGIVLDRERRALHDLFAGSTVVYDWGGRPAELPSPLGRWIAEHS
jgi:uncharacterized RDD family membrane protein YckC